jgi:serine/threonine protein kinase
VTGRLGEGGQGIVYLGRGSAGSVAIKLLHAQLIEDEPARARFVREVEVTKRVARFCTAQVLSVGTSQGRPYIISEYVPGPSLHRQLREEGPRSGSALDRLAINTATALAAIHQAGVVHRDFKPGNVLMGPDGPVVIDFGIARALDASGTMSGAVSQVVGTPAFMAPEQLAEGRIGPHTDMFAWAVTVVFAATGVPAFGHRSIPQVINRILHEEPDLGALDGRLRPVVAACLSKDPSRRPTARSLMDELMGHHAPATSAEAHSTATPPTPGPAGTPSSWSGVAGSAAAAGLAASRDAPNANRPGDPPSSVDAPNPSGAPGSARTDAAAMHSPAGGSPSWSGQTGDAAYLPPGDSSASAAGGSGRPGASGPGSGTRDAATMRLPLDGSASFAGRPGSPGEAGTGRLPAPGPPPPGGHPGSPGPSGGYPGVPGPSGPMAGPPERRKGRTALIVAAVAAVLIALVAGIGALASSKDDGKNGPAAAPPPSPKRAHHPTKHHTPSASRIASRRPVATVSAKPNPYTPQRLCGSGYGVVDRHGVGGARVYLLYNSQAGTNCVVTMVPKSTGKVPLSTSLVVKGGGRASRSGAYPFYAGPVRLPARGKCVMWGGSSKTARWTSGWSHCGK